MGDVTPDDLDLDLVRELLEESGRKKDNPLLALGAALVISQGEVERLRETLNDTRDEVVFRDLTIRRLEEQTTAYSETAAQRDTLLQENVKLKLEVEKLKTQAGWDRLRNG